MIIGQLALYKSYFPSTGEAGCFHLYKSKLVELWASDELEDSRGTEKGVS
jgi:hypothetical protein